MSKEPKFSFNSRVEFMDAERIHRVGYVKKAYKKGLLRRQWYDICEIRKDKGEGGAKIYVVRESWIFGMIEYKREKENKRVEFQAKRGSVKDLKDIKQLIEQ